MNTKLLEREVLAYIILEPSLYPTALAVVKRECFTDEQYKYIYKAMYDIHTKGLTIEYNNILTQIMSDFQEDGIKREIMVDCLIEVTNIPNFKYDLSLFEEKIYHLAWPEWENETVSNLANFIVSVVTKPISNAKKVQEMRERFNNRLDRAPVAKNKSNKGKHFKASLKKGKINSFLTGWDDLDKILNGLLESQLILLAGRPAMGKSSVAYNIVDYFLATYREAVAFFSLEINSDGIYKRMCSIKTGIDPSKLIRGTMTIPEEDEYDKAIDYYMDLEDKNQFTLETDGKYNLTAIEQEIRILSKKHKVGLVVIDYLQLIQGSGNSYERTTKISQGLKAIARKYNVIILALSQLSRQVEERANKRPVMSDLRDSGSLEQDADKIIMVYRDDYYHPEKTPSNIVELGVVKNREGAIGIAKLSINLVTGKIS